ncbi:phage minor head protein [Enterococcus olivae]
MSEKHRKEIESLLNKSESGVNKRLQKLYKELAEEVTQDIIELAEQIEQDDKFSKKLQKERLEAIRSQMYAKVDQLKGEEKKNIYDFLTHDGHVAFNELFYDFEMTEKIPLSFVMMTDKQINVIINTPVAGRKLSTRLKGNSTKMKQNMNRVLTRGFAKGWSTQKMAVQIAEIGGADYRRGMTIARTESGRVTSVTRQKSQEHAKELGIDTKKRWVSTLDGDTRTNHRKLDGQEVGIDEYFEIDGHKALQPHMFGVASEDCNCRCRTINVVVGYEPKLRRDNETGEEIEYQNYEDWLEGKKDTEEDKPLEKSKPNIFGFSPLTNDTIGNRERISTMIERSKQLINSYQEQTGADPVQLWREKGFVDKKNPYNDEKSKFVTWLLDESGYSDSVPQIITETEGLTPIFRGVNGYGNVTAKDQVKSFLEGKIQVSGAKRSANGRGIYFATDKSGAEKAISGSDSEMISAYILNDAKMLNRDALFEEKKYFKNHKDEFGEDADFYEFITSKNSLMDKQDEVFAILSGYDGIDAGAIQVIFNRSKVGVMK